MFPIDLGYVWEKLHVTVLSIAEEEGPLTKRIANAYISQFIRLDDSDLSQIPNEIAEELQDLLAQLGRIYRADPGEEDIGDLHEVGEVEARHIVERLVSLFDEVCRLSGSLQRE